MKSKYVGLTESEALSNQKLYGKNIVICKKNNRFVKNILKILTPMSLILIICSLIYLIFDKLIYAIIMIVISIILLISQICQYLKLTKTMKILQEFNGNTCRLIRDNKEIIINSEEITIDDIIILNEGNKVCADAIILESNNLYADESTIIKENINMAKSYDLLDKNAMLKSNYVYNGTHIIKGSGIAKVTSIGNKTEYAKYINNTATIENNNTLKKQITKLFNFFYVLSIIISVVILILTLLKGNLINGILSCLTITISLIPIVTPLTFMLFIYGKTYKTAKNNGLIKKISKLKKISEITCLCVDKFGIITESEIKVKEFYSMIDDKQALLNCALTCEKNTNDLFEKAIIEFISKNNINLDNNYNIVHKYSFNDQTKMMANIYEYNGELYIFVKGTLNSLFDICDLDVEEKYKLHSFQKQLFKKGLEVIAFGSNKINKIENDIFKYNIKFNGILGLYNPPKDNINKAIDMCRKNGIKVMMICEDKKEIASFIGKEIGIDNHSVLRGKELENMSDEELSDKIKDINIFSRIRSNHKLKIVNALKNNYSVVAVTGNSIVDKDVLESADIGISMNKIGTDFSKDLADLVILDDNFITMVNTIKETKKIDESIKKIMKYICLINILLALSSIILISLSYQPLILIIYIIILKLILESMCFILLIKK